MQAFSIPPSPCQYQTLKPYLKNIKDLIEIKDQHPPVPNLKINDKFVNFSEI
jgi:hypothetical protein